MGLESKNITIGFVIKNSKGLYYSCKKDGMQFIKFNKWFVVCFSYESEAINQAIKLDNDVYTIEKIVSTI